MFWIGLRAWLCFICLLLSASLARADATTLEAAETVPSGSKVKVKVKWTGPKQESDQIGIVPAGAPDNARLTTSMYVWGKSSVEVLTPEPTGEYEIRFVAGRSHQILARRKLILTPVSATLDAPASVVGGNQVPVQLTGPHNEADKIAILPAGAPEGAKEGHYLAYTWGKKTLSVKAPEQPGEYEIRYLRGQSGSTLARAKLTVTSAGASVQGPGTAVSGATISVAVTGPHSESDKIAILPAGAPEGAKEGHYHAYTLGRNKVSVKVPEQPGEYEIRYLTGDSGSTLAREALSIEGTTASIQGPGKAPAGETFKVSWKGPGNESDHIVVAPKGATEDKWVANAYVYKRSKPVSIRAPLAVGEYELRYKTGDSGTTLARDELEVTPAKQEPGLLRVTTAKSTLETGGAVEIILDASGSMLQRIGSERRIDIAKQTLTQLTSSVIPAGTPFALRVFGREASSCQSDLDVPLRPLDASAVASKVAALEAKSGAKTPIGASLEKVAADLSTVKGERLVILVTDGEETCGGNPRRAIEKLRKNGVNVRVNIVGFAVDDAKIATMFRQWSMAGNGAYFDARDAAGLNEALTSAIQPAYEVLDAQKKVVAEGLTGGEPVALLPGSYSVSLKGQNAHSRSVRVRAKETVSVQL